MSTPSDPTPSPSGNSAPAARAQPARTDQALVPSPPPPARTPQAPGAFAAPDQPTEPKRRPWAWIAVCGALALAVVGLTIWALSLNSDLDHQRDQTAAAQQQAEQASSQAEQLTQDVDNAINEAGQAAQGTLADLKAKLSALAGQSKPPAGGSGSSEPTATPTATTAAATSTAVENATPGAGG